jgi:transposase InsO family protein
LGLFRLRQEDSTESSRIEVKPVTCPKADRVLDKFTKWIEVKPVTCPKANRVLDFLDELIHRYGLPHRIITDLGSNFNNHQFWEYCENSGIDVRYVSVAHPRANGQVERANGMVLDALKKRLHDAANSKGGKWIKELPNAL